MLPFPPPAAPYCPSRCDPDFLRVVECKKVGTPATQRPQRSVCDRVFVGPQTDAGPAGPYVVRRPGEYIIRDSSKNAGGRELTPAGLPKTYLGDATLCLLTAPSPPRTRARVCVPLRSV